MRITKLLFIMLVMSALLVSPVLGASKVYKIKTEEKCYDWFKQQQNDGKVSYLYPLQYGKQYTSWNVNGDYPAWTITNIKQTSKYCTIKFRQW